MAPGVGNTAAASGVQLLRDTPTAAASRTRASVFATTLPGLTHQGYLGGSS